MLGEEVAALLGRARRATGGLKTRAFNGMRHLGKVPVADLADAPFNRQPVGSGPYRLVRLDFDEAELRLAEGHWAAGAASADCKPPVCKVLKGQLERTVHGAALGEASYPGEPPITQDGYGLINAGVTWRLNDHWSFALNGSNLADATSSSRRILSPLVSLSSRPLISTNRPSIDSLMLPFSGLSS